MPDTVKRPGATTPKEVSVPRPSIIDNNEDQ